MIEEMLDEMMRGWVMMYYWPFFVAGNADNWKELTTLCQFKKSGK
jgi:hypothetical protein